MTFHGLTCHIQQHRSGHWCGYVCIPESHPLFGKSYSEEIPLELATQKRQNAIPAIPLLCHATRGERGTVGIDLAFDVHGGITYSGTPYWDDADGALWCFGFDCAHHDSPPPDGGGFATRQCELLAKQLSEYAEVSL